MPILSVIGIAIGLAMDAFSVCVAAGATIKKLDAGHYFRLSFHFGLFQFLMPIAGFFCGSVVAGLISGWDHWIVLAILAFIGGKMLWESFEKKEGGEEKERKDPSRGSTLVMLAFATSVDAAAVGFSFSALGAPILLPSIVIGLVCSGFSAIGVLLGRGIGKAIGKWAERLGGAVLIGIGIKILVEHLIAG